MKKLVVNGTEYKFLYDFGTETRMDGTYYTNDNDPAWVIVTADGKLQRLFNGCVRDWEASYIIVEE